MVPITPLSPLVASRPQSVSAGCRWERVDERRLRWERGKESQRGRGSRGRNLLTMSRLRLGSVMTSDRCLKVPVTQAVRFKPSRRDAGSREEMTVRGAHWSHTGHPRWGSFRWGLPKHPQHQPAPTSQRRDVSREDGPVSGPRRGKGDFQGLFAFGGAQLLS